MHYNFLLRGGQSGPFWAGGSGQVSEPLVSLNLHDLIFGSRHWPPVCPMSYHLPLIILTIINYLKYLN